MKRWLIALVFLFAAPAFAQMPGLGPTNHQGYKPTWPAPGIPCGTQLVNCDFQTGRQSSAVLKKPVLTSMTPITGVSTTSITVGTGAKVFIVDLSKGSYGATDSITIGSAGTPTATMTGSVTSLSGTTLTLNITSTAGAGTFTDWQVTNHTPTGWFSSGGSTRARTGDAIDWDFRSWPENIRLDGTTFLTISQSLFDACALTNADINVPLIDNRAAASFSFISNTLDGCGYTGRLTAMVGNGATAPGAILFERNKIIRAPLDVYDFGSQTTTPITNMTVRYNYLQSTCTTSLSFGLHVDVTQIVNWSTTNLDYYNNVLDISCSNGAVSSLVTGPINMGFAATAGGAVSFNYNKAIGGGYAAFTGVAASATATLSITNLYIKNQDFQAAGQNNGTNGALTPNAAAFGNLTMNRVFSAINGAPLRFLYNNGVNTRSVYQAP